MAVRRSSSAKISDWLAGFEQPVDVRKYAILRIAFGFLATWYFFERLPFAWLYLSSGGWLNDQAYHEAFATAIRLPVVFQYWPTLLGLFFVFLGASLSWMVGFGTRFAGIVTWIGLLVVENQNPLLGFPGAEILRLVVFPLLFVPTGGRWSLDSWFHSYLRKDWASPIPLTLVRVQVIAAFWLMGYAKLQSQYWIEGNALVYLLMNPTVSRFSPVTVADFSWFFFPLSSVVSRFWMAFELIFPILMIFPILRRIVGNIASGLIFASLLIMKLGWLPLGLIGTLFAFWSSKDLDLLAAWVLRTSRQPQFQIWRWQLVNPVFFVGQWFGRYEALSAKYQSDNSR